MIHHISIDVDDPASAAAVFAEIFDGIVVEGVPFPWSVTAAARDEFGTAIEFYPRGSEVKLDAQDPPGKQVNPAPPQASSFHAAISVPRSDSEIFDAAARAGCTARKRPNGPFHVIELWVEDRWMIELMSPEQSEAYLKLAATIL